MKVIRVLALVFVVANLAIGYTLPRKPPVVLRMATPTYPMAAVYLGLQERIVASIAVEPSGRVTSTSFDRGDKMFHTVIESALTEWRFEASSKKRRNTQINFVFTLLPADSKAYVSSVFQPPSTVEVYAKRLFIEDSPGEE